MKGAQICKDLRDIWHLVLSVVALIQTRDNLKKTRHSQSAISACSCSMNLKKIRFIKFVFSLSPTVLIGGGFWCRDTLFFMKSTCFCFYQKHGRLQLVRSTVSSMQVQNSSNPQRKVRQLMSFPSTVDEVLGFQRNFIVSAFF